MMKTTKRHAFMFLVLACLMPMAAVAAVPMPPVVQKPSATHHVVLQISDANPATQNLILNVASNLVSYYGADKIDLEVVAFGPGLQLLMADNANASRIVGLAKEQGVKFDACENTLNAMTRALGHKPALNPDAQIVPSGAARLVDLAEHHFVVLRP